MPVRCPGSPRVRGAPKVAKPLSYEATTILTQPISSPLWGRGTPRTVVPLTAGHYPTTGPPPTHIRLAKYRRGIQGRPLELYLAVCREPSEQNRRRMTVVQRWLPNQERPAEAGESGSTRLSQLQERLVKIVQEHGHLHFPEPVQLASGDWTNDFIDTNKALAQGPDLRLAVAALLELVAEMEIQFDALGGLTMGADKFAHGVAMVTDAAWFSVRKKAKERGTRKRIEGAELGPGTSVLLVDDVVTRGDSIADALHAIRETGATVVGAVSLVDRGHFGEALFQREMIPYRSLVTYADLGINPAGNDAGATAATG